MNPLQIFQSIVRKKQDDIWGYFEVAILDNAVCISSEHTINVYDGEEKLLNTIDKSDEAYYSFRNYARHNLPNCMYMNAGAFLSDECVYYYPPRCKYGWVFTTLNDLRFECDRELSIYMAHDHIIITNRHIVARLSRYELISFSVPYCEDMTFDVYSKDYNLPTIINPLKYVLKEKIGEYQNTVNQIKKIIDYEIPTLMISARRLRKEGTDKIFHEIWQRMNLFSMGIDLTATKRLCDITIIVAA